MKKTIFVMFVFAALLAAGCSKTRNTPSIAGEEKVLRIAYPDTLTTLDIINGSAATMLLEIAGVVQTLVSVDSKEV